MNKLTSNQLEELMQKLNEKGLDQIEDVMNTEELKAYKNNCLEAIDRQVERIEKEKDGSTLQKIAIETLEELEQTIKNIDKKLSEQKELNLTEKETKVLKSIHSNTYEMGLPVEVDYIKNDTNYSKRVIVGVLSSLYKKGYVESYDMDLDNEFMITEEGYELVEKYL